MSDYYVVAGIVAVLGVGIYLVAWLIYCIVYELMERDRLQGRGDPAPTRMKDRRMR